MLTESRIEIAAPPGRVYEFTADILRWPERLPHYRFVRELGRDGEALVVRMACRRSGIPVSWESRFWREPDGPRIRFEHLRAWTKGMVVVWHYEEVAGGTRIRLTHDLSFRWPFLAPVAEPVIGGFFIEHIAGQTLATFKRLLESGQ